MLIFNCDIGPSACIVTTETEKGKFLESEKGEGKLFQRYESLRVYLGLHIVSFLISYNAQAQTRRSIKRTKTAISMSI